MNIAITLQKIGFLSEKKLKKFPARGLNRGPFSYELSHKTTTLKELA